MAFGRDNIQRFGWRNRTDFLFFFGNGDNADEEILRTFWGAPLAFQLRPARFERGSRESN